MNPCYYCGADHEGVCARVESIEYHPDGTVKKVTFHADAPLTRLKVDGIFAQSPSPFRSENENNTPQRAMTSPSEDPPMSDREPSASSERRVGERRDNLHSLGAHIIVENDARIADRRGE